MNRYHVRLGFPDSFRRPVGIMHLTHTRHAMARAKEKGFTLPDKVNVSTAQIFEIGMAGKTLKQIALRIPYDATYDLSIVISLSGPRRIVKTAWQNEITDIHRTLNPATYTIP